MKLYVLSDLHVEFANFTPDVEAAQAADVVVLTGDIHLGTQGLDWARHTFPSKRIFYVAGNHEFYREHWDLLLPRLRAQAELHQIDFFENDTVTIGDFRFLGTTLWTDFDYFGASDRQRNMRLAERALNDFKLIEAYPLSPGEAASKQSDETFDGAGSVQSIRLTAKHTLQRHQDSMVWLKDELAKGEPSKTVVLTHHFPHRKSCARQWASDPLTAIFGSQLPESVLLGAKLWIHGHTHDSCDYSLGNPERSVRVICNPRGYPLGSQAKSFENPKFNPALLVDLADGKDVD